MLAIFSLSDANSTPRYITITQFNPRASGSSPFPASHTLPLSVRIQVPRNQTAMLWANVTNVATGIMVFIDEAGRSAYIAAYFSLPSL